MSNESNEPEPSHPSASDINLTVCNIPVLALIRSLTLKPNLYELFEDALGPPKSSIRYN